jgi:hypothetical protein
MPVRRKGRSVIEVIKALKQAEPAADPYDLLLDLLQGEELSAWFIDESHGRVEIPPKYWRGDSGPSDFQYDLKSGFCSMDIRSRSDVDRIGGQISIDAAALVHLAVEASSVSERRGRRPKYSWDDFFYEIIRRANLPDGLPSSQADFEREIAEWCVNKWGEEPSESVLREKISTIYRSRKRTKAGN